jgi:hypothetical protein
MPARLQVGVLETPAVQGPWGLEDELYIQDFKSAANKNDWSRWLRMANGGSNAGEEDPRVPAQLMWDYLVQLREPLLDQDALLEDLVVAVKSGTPSHRSVDHHVPLTDGGRFPDVEKCVCICG